jgi:hypothetical protein
MRKTLVHHWRFETGEPEQVGKSIIYPTGYREGAPRGWYCWVYPEDDRAFEEWMAKNCPTADCTHRFNSGDPMYTVYIKEDKEATIFQLKWR